MYQTRLNLLMQGSNVHSKFQVVSYHYQRISSSQYLLLMQTMVHSLKLRNQMQHSHSQRRTQCIISPIGLLDKL
ncbi:hypothetical protein H5410_050881 [Solanum commersonii]|uniref:Uncharacterized protein n=1 Tax=Solanum commersonii TaxID=4109 RepID=A0A9J5WZ45_SOLCO|nr:hypothetical protein H5410_050881 [Solanum commersonii]